MSNKACRASFLLLAALLPLGLRAQQTTSVAAALLITRPIRMPTGLEVVRLRK
jgi:hypothetical protein